MDVDEAVGNAIREVSAKYAGPDGFLSQAQSMDVARMLLTLGASIVVKLGVPAAQAVLLFSQFRDEAENILRKEGGNVPHADA